MELNASEPLDPPKQLARFECSERKKLFTVRKKKEEDERE